MQSTLECIVNNFPISDEEYSELEKQFGNLCYYATWQLQKRNSASFFGTDGIAEDEVQNLRIALIRAASYYKRQLYIEECFLMLDKYMHGRLMRKILRKLKKLWADRKRHGANRQTFGIVQEKILDDLVSTYVPEEKKPSKDRKLVIDKKFKTYAKQILWNEIKAMGKKITREKSWRSGLISLSEYDYIGTTMSENHGNQEYEF